jgi:glycosyltransferase involved in cell wall biosynthesis
MTPPSPRIAVLVPCFNEEAAVATVVADFRKALPSARILVYDNNSSDRTAAVAREVGAEVRSERRQGKGHVVRRMFADVDADIYGLVDGDATYDAPRRDGLRILGTILKLYRSEKPLRFFTAIGIFLALVSIGIAIPIVVTYLETGLVPRLPTAVLSMDLTIVALLSASSGLVLDTVTHGRRGNEAAGLSVAASR